MANRFWVGGTAAWDDTVGSKWSTTSGGSGGASVPTASDIAIFDGNSNPSGSGSSYTVTISSATAGGVNISNPSSGVITIDGTAELVIGNTTSSTTNGINVGTGINWIATGNLRFNNTGGKAIRTSVPISSPLVVNTGATAVLTVFNTATINNEFNLISGIVTVGANTLSCVSANLSGTASRQIRGGSGQLEITGGNSEVLNLGTTTSFVGNGALDYVFSNSGSTGTRVITVPITNVVAVSNSVNIMLTSGSDTVSITANGWIKHLNTIGFSGTVLNNGLNIRTSFMFSNTATYQSGSNTLNVFSATSSNLIYADDGVILDFPVNIFGGTGFYGISSNLTISDTKTLTTNTNGSFLLSNNSITAGFIRCEGSSTWSVSSGENGTINLTGVNGNVFNVSSFNFQGSGYPIKINLLGNPVSGIRTVSIPVLSGFGGTISVNGGSDEVRLIGNVGGLDFTGFNGTINAWSSSNGSVFIPASTTIGSGVTNINLNSANNTTFDIDINTEVSANINLSSTVPFNLQSNLTISNTRFLTVNNGTTLNSNGHYVKVGNISGNGNINAGFSTFEITGQGFSSGNYNITWINSGNLIFTSNGTNIVCRSGSANSEPFRDVTFINSTSLLLGNINANSISGTLTSNCDLNVYSLITINCNYWKLTGTGPDAMLNIIAGDTKINVTNKTKDIDYLKVLGIHSDIVTPVTFYVGKNSINNGGNIGVAFYDCNSPKTAYILKSNGTFDLPVDWCNSQNEVHLFGAGGSGSNSVISGANVAAGAGGGGGGYTKIVNFKKPANSSITYTIGLGDFGTDGTATTWHSGAYSANGGSRGISTAAGSLSSIGGSKGIGATSNGGIGASGGVSSTLVSEFVTGGGGGGAGGPYGNGGNGGNGIAGVTQIYGGGGGAGGGGTSGTNASSTSAGNSGVEFISGNERSGRGGFSYNDGSDCRAIGGSGGGTDGNFSLSVAASSGMFGGGGGGGSSNTTLSSNGASGANGAIIVVYDPYTTGGNFSQFF